MKSFICDDFLLQTETAKILYHEYAAKMPVFDYHCHLSSADIVQDRQYDNLTQLWLYNDHYKWRAMRWNGISEKYCTGDASDWEKFKMWAQTMPAAIRNPLYHWTHLELKKFFGIENVLLNPETAKIIYDQCNEKLKKPQFSCRNLILKANVKVICTTDDPTDSLENHVKLKQDDFGVSVLPTWRPDKAMAIENPRLFNDWICSLERVSGVEIKDFRSFIEALRKRHDFFHETGCRISGHSIELPYAQEYTLNEINSIFNKCRNNNGPDNAEILNFNSAMMFEFGVMDYEKGWVQQLHIGVIRNNNTRMFKVLGSDTGFDSIGDFNIAKPLSRHLDRLDRAGRLTKTIIYNSNPVDNVLIAAMVGNFQNESCPGKIQFGSSWWFLDQKNGIEDQINTLSNLGLLSRFIGMHTDSRSFLSLSRHEYFRRIICNILGTDVENGEIPADLDMLGKIVQDICFNNIKNYFGLELSK